MSQGGGSFPLGDPGGGKGYFTDDDGMSDTASGGSGVFARSGKMLRSPVLSEVAAGLNKTNAEVGESCQEKQLRLGLAPLFTPKASKFNRSTKLGELKKKVDELYKFVKAQNNAHHKIKELATSIKAAFLPFEQEQQAWRERAEKAEKELKEKTVMLAEAMATPRGPSTSRVGKRDRDSPGEEEVSKKQKEDMDQEEGNEEDDSGWKIAQNKKKEKKKIEEKESEKKKKVEKKNEEKKNEKPMPRRERNKGDALIVEAGDKVSYAAILRKVRDDPELKELGEKVVKTRRTQKGELIFELAKDPAVKSSAFKELVAKALEGEASVRALTQETVIECRYLDEVTSANEVRKALQELGQIGDVSMTIRLRKAYGGTQTASIRTSTVVANKLLDIGKVRVGWAVGLLKATPRVPKQMERCFKCMDFGHQARNCDGPDRSKLCRKCGEGGHIAIDCSKPARCMLCRVEHGNDHVTGGFKCPVYRKAAATQQ